MADRVSASIVLGGTISASEYAELADIIASEGLSTEWDGGRFDPTHRSIGEPLRLYAHDVAWGCLSLLETWCIDHKLPFSRWCGGCAGQWGPVRVVFKGEGEPTSYAADEEDSVVIGRQTAERLGSMAAIIAYFDAADAEIPAFAVEGDTSGASAA